MRKQCCLMLTTVHAGTVSAAEAQQPKKVPRIGYLSIASSSDFRSEAIRQGLRELGYIEGQNIAVEYRWADGRDDRVTELAAELVRLKVDVIVAAGGSILPVVKNATKTIPIVLALWATLLGQASLTALPVPAATSPALQTLPRS